jgi:hypothetical protein
VNKFQTAAWETLYTDQSNLFIHENFNEENLSNDIGLIQLTTTTPQLLDHPHINVIALPNFDEINLNWVGKNATVSGFGSTGGSSWSSVLNKVEMEIVENRKCLEALPPFVSDGNLCTNTDEGRSACNGDEGERKMIKFKI